MLGAIPADPSEPLLEHIATDGESYGHHHRFGDMALAYCFHYLEKNHLAELTIYGEFLQKHPPLSEVQIFENSSWSCSHGVERWRANCGCNSGGRPGWSQAWRGPLRDTLDWLRDQLAPVYEQEMRSFCADPWALRDQYIDVVLDRSEDNIRQFFQKNFVKVVSDEDRSRCLKLLEIQRHAMLMYTSCGWFFDELSGIETTQILQYAARCLQLVKELTEVDLEPEFRTRLKSAPSNVPELKDGTQVYDIFVRPKIVNIFRVGVHYALATVFEGFPDEAEIFCYSIKREFFKHHTREGKHLVTGKATIRSYITLETQTIYFASVYMGKSELRAGVSANLDDERFLKLRDGLEKMFEAGEDLHLVDLLRQEFQDQIYSLWHLFKNTQEKVLNKILEPTMGEMRRLFRHIYEHHFPLVQAKKDMRISLPKALAATVEFVLNRDLREMLQREYLDLEDLKKLVDEVKRWSFELDNASLSFAATEKINGLIQTLEKDPENVEVLKNIENILKTLKVLSLAWDRWKSQNIYFSIGKRFLKNMQDKSAQGDANATQWVASFNALGAYLEV